MLCCVDLATEAHATRHWRVFGVTTYRRRGVLLAHARSLRGVCLMAKRGTDHWSENLTATGASTRPT